MSDTPDSSKNYQVLARKYRPMTFEDMIGQEAMVKTLTNAFATGRVAHAFMLTGVRGIGKTTTARLLARALNYEGPHEGPSVKLDPPGIHCEAINKSSHMDVMEMDAASRTGVGDIREILDSVRYAPVSARYKVYIIDEVHMLSGAAFNALLKTLEEPPDHAKFIFATTEIRKIPITVLSRCQRFDLRRVEAAELAIHLKGICDQEKANVSDDGLALIGRAAEGSVRDGLSLLDQAIVQAEGNAEVDAEQIRSMLGLADRLRIFDLFAHAANGDPKGALIELRAQYNDGAAPEVIIRDLLDCCHEMSRAKVLGAEAEYDAAQDQVARLIDLADGLTMGQITRLWQMLLKSYDDVRRAPDPLAAAEMALLRMSVAGELPPPELAAQLLEGLKNVPDAPANAAPPTRPVEAPVARGGSAQPLEAPVMQPAPPQSDGPALDMESLETLVASMPKTETQLKYDMRKYIRPVKYEAGTLVFAPAPGTPENLVVRMTRYLPEATSRPWHIEIVEGEQGGQSLIEQQQQALHAQQDFEQNHPVVQKAKELFPGVEIEFQDISPVTNVIQADFNKDEDMP
jgi:DNA polymerase-3 subunit gamma/tau